MKGKDKSLIRNGKIFLKKRKNEWKGERRKKIVEAEEEVKNARRTEVK